MFFCLGRQIKCGHSRAQVLSWGCFFFCCSESFGAFSSSQSMSSGLLPTQPVAQHCAHCLGRNFSDYRMIHSPAVPPAYVIRVLLPHPQCSQKYSALLVFILFLLWYKRVAGNLSCGEQVWSALTRFFWLSFCFSSMCVYTQSTALSFLPKPGSNYTLSLCCFHFCSATNPNPVVNTSLLQVLHLPAAFSNTACVCQLQKASGWCWCDISDLSQTDHLHSPCSSHLQVSQFHPQSFPWSREVLPHRN